MLLFFFLSLITINYLESFNHLINKKRDKILLSYLIFLYY